MRSGVLVAQRTDAEVGRFVAVQIAIEVERTIEIGGTTVGIEHEAHGRDVSQEWTERQGPRPQELERLDAQSHSREESCSPCTHHARQE